VTAPNGNPMIDRFDQLDPIEASLRELADAEQAELFRRTHLDARSLLRSSSALSGAPQVLPWMRWVLIAAVFALAVTICGWVFTTRTGPTRLASFPSGMIASATGGCDGRFFGCLTGPNGTPAADCGAYDYDADGDIDLVDARTYQLNCNEITR